MSVSYVSMDRYICADTEISLYIPISNISVYIDYIYISYLFLWGIGTSWPRPDWRCVPGCQHPQPPCPHVRWSHPGGAPWVFWTPPLLSSPLCAAGDPEQSLKLMAVNELCRTRVSRAVYICLAALPAGRRWGRNPAGEPAL